MEGALLIRVLDKEVPVPNDLRVRVEKPCLSYSEEDGREPSLSPHELEPILLLSVFLFASCLVTKVA